MKIKLANNQEINIKRLSKCYHPEDDRYELNMIIDSSEGGLEDVVGVLTEENTKSVILSREDYADARFTNLKLNYSSEDITDNSHEISAFFDISSKEASAISEA